MTDEVNEPGDPPPTLNFGVANVDGKVVVRFSTSIQWFDMEPALAIRLAESIINNAMEAQTEITNSKIAMPPKPTLVIPRRN